MSFLAPLFLIGTGLIALPILFHLIRQQPKRSVEFSSLIFLQPSPPRLTRRSRLDNWFLLLLRGLALLMIVAAFARPFFRSNAQTQVVAAASYTVVLVDRSASMRREDLWQQVQDQYAQEIESLLPEDRLAVVAFDDRAEVLQGFADATSAGATASREALADLLRGTTPGWGATDLGGALVLASGLLEEAVSADDAIDAETSIVVLSDLQTGSEIDSLQGFQWPEAVAVRLEAVAVAIPDNASLAVIAPAAVPQEEDSADSESKSYRVLIRNAEDSNQATFELGWEATDQTDQTPEDLISVTVPPGSNRVVRVPEPRGGATAVRLSGDGHQFDNRFYVVVPEPVKAEISVVGLEVEDPRADPFFFLDRVAIPEPNRQIDVVLRQPADEDLEQWADSLEPTTHPLVVVHQVPPPKVLEKIANYLTAGGHVLVVADSTNGQDGALETAIANLAEGQPIELSQPAERDYVLLSRINFDSPVFESLNDPRFSDFSKIQIWRHQSLSLESPDAWSVLAEFDDGGPAMVRRSVGDGNLFVLGMGWQPTESQLALSGKFVPMIAGLLARRRSGVTGDQYWIGSRRGLKPGEGVELVTPEGEAVPFRSAEDFDAIDRPGIYRLAQDARSQAFAANVATDESRTAPLDPSRLEQLGVTLYDAQREAVLSESERQLRDMELERRQQWWRALLITALVLLGAETLWSGWKRMRQPAAVAV